MRANDFRMWMARQVSISMVDGELAVEGTLVDETAATVTLEHATVTHGSSEPLAVDGVLVVMRARILWLQVI